MKYTIATSITLLATMSFAAPGTAQIQNRPQDFFEQGRERLEREIETLQTEALEEADSQAQEAEPLLEVNPSPEGESRETPADEQETPNQKPDQHQYR